MEKEQEKTKPQELTDEEAEQIAGGDPPGSGPPPSPVSPDPWE